MSIEAALQALVDDDVSAWPDMETETIAALVAAYTL